MEDKKMDNLYIKLPEVEELLKEIYIKLGGEASEIEDVEVDEDQFYISAPGIEDALGKIRDKIDGDGQSEDSQNEEPVQDPSTGYVS